LKIPTTVFICIFLLRMYKRVACHARRKWGIQTDIE